MMTSRYPSLAALHLMSTVTADSLRVSNIAPNQVQSEIRAMSVACAAVDGINLAQGVCDTDTPHPVVEAAITAMRAGHNIYTRAEGIALLREVIADKFARFNGLGVDAETQVLVTSGATGAMQATCMALLNAGDECIVFEPFYGYHLSTLRSMRIQPVIVPLHAPNWKFDAERLRAAITSRTRAIILNSPSNPSGKVFTRAELEALAEVAIEHDLFVITDEMYEYFVYDGRTHQSLATLPGMAERTVTISGFSKTFSVTGWRLGYLTANERWMPSISYFHDLVYVCAPSPLQHGVAAGLLALPEKFYTGVAEDHQRKRDVLCNALRSAGLAPSVPDGAYYILADAGHLAGKDGRERARWLLKETGVAAVAGSAFFGSDADGTNRGEHLLRFCFAKKDDELAEAARRIATLKR
jgi:aminotransferase